MTATEALAKIWSDIGSLHWWITAVVFGIVINLAAAFLKDPIDRLLATRSEKRQRARDRDQALFMRKLKAFVENPHLLVLEALAEQRARFHFLAAMIMALLFIALAILVRGIEAGLAPEVFSIVGLLFGFGLVLVAMRNLSDASARSFVVNAGQRHVEASMGIRGPTRSND